MTFFARPPRLGTWIKLATADSVAIMADAGFDFIVIDLEHAPLDLGIAAQMINLALACGVDPLVRVPDHGESTIQRVLDAGAAGVLVPRVDTAADAVRVAAATRFPPEGRRGAGGTSRAGRWGLTPRSEYLRAGNTEVVCIPQLESPQAIESASDILAVPGVDAVFLGAGDLSLSLGAEMNDPVVRGLLDKARTAARDAGKPCGAACANVDAAVRAADLGQQFLIMGNDATMLARTAHSMTQGFRAKFPATGRAPR